MAFVFWIKPQNNKAERGQFVILAAPQIHGNISAVVLVPAVGAQPLLRDIPSSERKMEGARAAFRSGSLVSRTDSSYSL